MLFSKNANYPGEVSYMKKDRNREEMEYTGSEKAENSRLEREEKLRRAKNHRVMTVLDRIFGFMLATVLVIGVAGLGLVYVLERGPSPSLTNLFVRTMEETRRFDFMANIFLTEDEVSQIRMKQEAAPLKEFDSSLIAIASADSSGDGSSNTSYPEDEDGDGIIFEEISQSGYTGYLITVLDPKRIILGVPDSYGGTGLTLEEMVQKYDALGGINAGGFQDDGGSGLGGVPEGLTLVDGKSVGKSSSESIFVGFDEAGVMYVGYYDDWSANRDGIKNGVSFGPILIMNGEAVNPDSLPSGVNPRTAIGQRSDGAVLMLVIDGRQVHSMGATYADCLNIMLDHGAVNAINMDGGSSTSMYYNGAYVNRNSSKYGARPLPSAFLFK